MIQITDEAVQDVKALLTGMSHSQFKEFLENSIRAADATSLVIEKDVEQKDGALIESFVLKFLK